MRTRVRVCVCVYTRVSGCSVNTQPQILIPFYAETMDHKPREIKPETQPASRPAALAPAEWTCLLTVEVNGQAIKADFPSVDFALGPSELDSTRPLCPPSCFLCLALPTLFPSPQALISQSGI